MLRKMFRGLWDCLNCGRHMADCDCHKRGGECR